MLSFHRGSIFPGHFADTPLVLECQGFEKRCSHDPVQFPQPGDILCQLVVLDKPAIFRLVASYDREVVIAHQFLAMMGFALTPVESAFVLDDFGWNP